MKLTVLGKYGPFPAATGACSGYLVETDQASIILDLGNGALSRLLYKKPRLTVDGVILSHLHSDHMSDMLVLRYALKQLHSRDRSIPTPLSVVAPSEPELEFRQLISSGVYDMIAAKDGMKLKFKDLTVVLHRMTHTVVSYAVELMSGGKRMVYTGDTGYNMRLESLCGGADLLLADTCYLNADKTTENAAHLTAGEAGRLAKRCGVKQLICTHIWGGSIDDAGVLGEARAEFPTAEVAVEMRTYEV
jgi:ribonuclease BN (tRNA processing enzyme)